MAKAVPLQLGVDLEKPFETAPALELHPLSIEFMNWDLARSGLEASDIQAYPSMPLAMKTIGTYVIPFPDKRMWKLRIDRRLVENGEKQAKYKAPSGITDIWYPHDALLTAYREDEVLYIIEGEKKAAKFHKQWPTLSVIGIAGCYNATYTLDSGVRALLPNITACLKPGKSVVVVFDGDIEENYNIQHAAHALADLLALHQVTTFICKPPLGKGVDDWLVADPQGSIGDLVPIALQSLEMGRKQLFKTLQLTTNSDGNVYMNEDNAARIIQDRFKDHVYLDRRMGLIVSGEPGNIDDLEAVAVTYIQKDLLAGYSAGKIHGGLKIWMNSLQRSPRDLIQETVRAHPWDGVPRLETWGSKHFETDFPAWANEWGRILFTQLGLRILMPGTKCDYCNILAGPQGIGKSTFFEDVAKFDDISFYHACTTIADSAGDNNRSQNISFGRSLIVDLAEGVIFEQGRVKGAMDRIKQIITQTQDEYREVYAKGTRIDKRGFVFVGTTNRRDQLGDQTGSRRFLNMWVTKIERLSFADKMQILAEVREKEHQIRNSAWYEFKVNIEDAPAKLREENEHIKSVHELVNSQFQRSDADTEFIRSLIESGDLGSTKDGLFLSAVYIASRQGHNDTRTKNAIGRVLSQLSTSNTFPYKLEYKRLRIQQVNMTKQQELSYTDGITNNQGQLSGYLITNR